MAIVLTIFKIIIFIILGLLALFLAVILLALISPIKYEADGGIHAVKASVTWFYRIIRVKFSYEKEILSYKAYVLFFRVFDSNPDASKSENAPDKKRVSVIDIILIPIRWCKRFIKRRTTKVVDTNKIADKEQKSVVSDSAAEVKLNEAAKGLEIKKIEPVKTTEQTRPDKTVKRKQETDEKSKKSSEKNNDKKRKFSPKDTYQYLKKLWDYDERKEVVHATLQFIKKEFRLIKPEKFEIYGTLGFEDPYNTGVLLGVVSQINEFFTHFIDINFKFNEQTTDLYARIKGRITIGSILLAFVKYMLSKPIFKIILRVLRKRRKSSGRKRAA